jgi:hypothetical protein
MNVGDRLVDRFADRLQRVANDFAAAGGTKAQFADELAGDAAFVRKLKPSLMVARFRGEAPTHTKPEQGVVAPSGPQLGTRPNPAKQGGPNPFIVVGAAFVAGIAFAKLVDWRGHAHPRG